MPVPLILDGKWSDDDIQRHNFSKEKIERYLKMRGAKVKNVIILAIDEQNRATFQQKGKAMLFENIFGGFVQ